ncbi:DUF3846 domain-containing protein [Frankia sp. ArI3]|nr:DUF3846 domain-containing protein [Frankia sp. ArI3]
MSASLTGVLLRAEVTRPPEAVTFHADNLAFYRGVVGGNIEPVHLLEPAGSVYVNEGGLDLRLPMNPRATLLAAAANPLWRGGVLFGDALVVGPVDEDGWDTSAPEDYTKVLLAETGCRFHVEFQAPSSGRRRRLPGLEWTGKFTAYADGLRLADGFPGMAVRVVPAP